MNCADLAKRIEKLQPDTMPRDVARLCLLLSNFVENFEVLEDDLALMQAWQDIGLMLQGATDQHAAMTEELETLLRSDPKGFDPEQIWILIRAIRVQSQILQLYVGMPALDV